MQNSMRITNVYYRAAKGAFQAASTNSTKIVIQKRSLTIPSIAESTKAQTFCRCSASPTWRTNTTQGVAPSIRLRTIQSASITRFAQLRSASTTATPAPTSATGSSSLPLIDWPTFFRLRITRRRYSLVFSIFTSIGTSIGAIILITSTPFSDTLTSSSPIPDPFVTLGAFTFFGAGLGWLIGPTFGQGIWRMMHKAQVPGFMAREKDFYERVKRYRVDPRGASAQNPVPDYYGEKVGSRDQWRTWLKDQRAFNRKREGKATGMGGGLGFRGRGVSK